MEVLRAVRADDGLPHQEVRRELVGPNLHEPLDLALSPEARDGVAGLAEDRLDEGLGDAALERGAVAEVFEAPKFEDDERPQRTVVVVYPRDVFLDEA